MAYFAMFSAGLIACAFSVLMFFSRSLYTSAVCLLVVLFQAAVFFFFSGAPMLAFLQIMIYAGAVMVLIVIMIMAAGAHQYSAGEAAPMSKPLAAAAVLIPLAETALLVARAGLREGALGGALAVQAQLGPVLFGRYAVAAEAVTLLMLIAGLAILGEREPR